MVSEQPPLPGHSVNREIAERIGDLFEQTGNQHMAGRVFGWLLVSGEPRQSQRELSQALQASKGAISQAVRLLIRLGLVSRISVPGERCHFYRIAPDAWRCLASQYLNRIRVAREIAQNGLAQLADQRPEDRAGLEQMLGFAEFLEERGSAVLREFAESQRVD